MHGARRYLRRLGEKAADGSAIPNCSYMAAFLGVDRREDKDSQALKDLMAGSLPGMEGAPSRLKQLLGAFERKEKGRTTGEISRRYDKSRYRFLLTAPFEIGAHCCDVMKKGPFHGYAKGTGRRPITAQMAGESRLRASIWLRRGCNAFEAKNPISNPMSFWTEQDVLLYIKANRLPIASVYGEIVEDWEATGATPGQMTVADLMNEYGLEDEAGGQILRTTGCRRTGCMFCGYGCHLEKEPNRFQRMRETHPDQYDHIMRPWAQGGLGYKEVIDWINENGGLHIKY